MLINSLHCYLSTHINHIQLPHGTCIQVIKEQQIRNWVCTVKSLRCIPSWMVLVVGLREVLEEQLHCSQDHQDSQVCFRKMSTLQWCSLSTELTTKSECAPNNVNMYIWSDFQLSFYQLSDLQCYYIMWTNQIEPIHRASGNAPVKVNPPPPPPGKGGDISGAKTDRWLSKLSRYAGSWMRIAPSVSESGNLCWRLGV